MKYKKTILIASSIVALSLSAYLIFNQWNKESITIEEKPVASKAGVVIPVIEINEVRTEPIGKELPFSMTELDVQIAIHGMSHQKIRASNDDKWDLLLMTPERIERLIVVVEANNVKYRKNVDTYLDILNRWKNNDFSRVDLDHNAVWKMQDGTWGKAIGIFTFEEEKEFIKEHFNIEVVDVTSD